MFRLKYNLKRSKKPFPLKWKASYMPGKEERFFLTQRDAWDWIEKNSLCKHCKEELQKGGFQFSNGIDEDEWFDIFHPASTACGAEWFVDDITERKKDIIYFLRSKKEKERLRKNKCQTKEKKT